MLIGHLLNERYKVVEAIGGGGMADVYLAEDLILDRQVAIKVLRMDYADDEEFIARFDREAQAAASLSHPNIVNIYDVGEDEQILFMAMEYVDGLTLKEYIQKHAPLDAAEALAIMKQIASAIAHAHANDIIHRDIKPQNILLDTYGNVKVTDFGIAMALSATALTQTNSVMGSVHYLSPEQARGGAATKKSDIYSLGIVLFELLTGRLPFSGQSPVSIALMHLQYDTPSVKRFNQNAPQSVENSVLKATAKDPFHRYDSVDDMERDLDTALNPDRRDEEKFMPPAEEGDETKAIPIITDDAMQSNAYEDTTVNSSNEDTKPHSDNKTEQTDKGSGGEEKVAKKRRRKKWPILFSILALVLAAGAATFFLLPGNVDIPDVSGMNYEEALTELRDSNLDTKREMDYSEEIDEGQVIETDPEAGSTVNEDTLVTMMVSQGKETVTMSDYTGDDYDQVKRILKNKGFDNITAKEDYSDEHGPGKIVSQVHPSPETDVIPEETEVIFDVSKGSAPIHLNNVAGMTKQKAADTLEDQGLDVVIKEEASDNISEGNVINQDPEAGTKMKAGDTVKVTISNGPEEKPPVNHEVTLNVPYSPDEEMKNQDEKPEQTVSVYIGDSNHSIDETYETYTITDDKELKIPLTIAPGSVGEYKVMRDDQVVIDKSVSYKEVAGD
ncbi:serine/threonine protein kinase PrkC [Barrientosiimonas marina]|uniref:non-specific serine/threonine protein kinase n=1 Tax=Lentibacillus kimchii TaxID=1542911 RepID=A0ABW2UT98_9BACI